MSPSFDPNVLVADFVQVAALAGTRMAGDAITVLPMPKPHRAPSRQPSGMAAVYTFWLNGSCLKVGKVWTNSNARYCSHHYGVRRAPSTLAKSLLLAREELRIDDLSDDTVGPWICQHCDRFDFLMPASFGPNTLSLLEAFLQCRLKPRFEGFASQRIA